MSKVATITIPDLSRFGFYLCPKFYMNEFGFSGEARGLLLLDKKGMIDLEVAKQNNFTRLFTSASSVLYAINPNQDGHYLTASQLLQSLKLGRIANHINTTLPELLVKFKKECADSEIPLDSLEAVVEIGYNTKQNQVFEMLSGRFLVNDDNERVRDANPPDLLYSLNEDGTINEDWLLNCLQALLYPIRGKQGTINSTDLANIAKKILCTPPPKLSLNDNSFTAISFIEKQAYPQKLHEQMLEFIKKKDSLLIGDFFDVEISDMDMFINSVYQRNIAQLRAYQIGLPAPAIILLGKVLFFDNKTKVYCPNVGDISMLSMLIAAKKQLGVELELYEEYQDVKAKLLNFMEVVDADDIIYDTVSSQAGEKHELSISYTADDISHIGIRIPATSENTHVLAHQVIIDTLEKRADEGRSIFISPVDEPNNLGKISSSSESLIKYLLKTYDNTYVLDASAELLAPNIIKHPVRLYFIGNKSVITDSYAYDKFIEEKQLNVIDGINSLSVFCSEYINLLQSEQISNAEIMSVFDVGISELLKLSEDAFLEYSEEIPQSEKANNTENPIVETKDIQAEEGSLPEEIKETSISKEETTLEPEENVSTKEPETEYTKEIATSELPLDDTEISTTSETGGEKDTMGKSENGDILLDALESHFDNDVVDSDSKEETQKATEPDVTEISEPSNESYDETESNEGDDYPDLDDFDISSLTEQVTNAVNQTLEYDGDDPDFDEPTIED